MRNRRTLISTKDAKQPRPGQKVTLLALPAGFVDDLPLEDQQAITAVIGKQILLKGYEDDGRAELEFIDAQGIIHTIYIVQNTSSAKIKGRPIGRPKTEN